MFCPNQTGDVFPTQRYAAHEVTAFPRDGGRSRENDCEWKSACSVSVFEPLCQRFVRLIERFGVVHDRPTGMRAYTLFVIFCV